MIAFTDISVKLVEETDSHGVYEIAPLVRGYGNTLANTLRRILLSSIEGYGVTSVRIDGVKHEFSTIDGVKEDVLELILNLKNLKLKMNSDEPQLITLRFDGKGEVTGADVDGKGVVEVLNKDLHIATITDAKTSLNIEMTVEKGVGYRSANVADRKDIGLIPVDVDFSPIEKVAFHVLQTRKGQDANYDAVNIDITTNGAIGPRDALLQATKILQDFSGKVMAAMGVAEEEIKAMAEASLVIEKTENEEKTYRNEMDGWNIEDLPISRRAKSSLSAGGYRVLGDLRGVSKTDLLNLPGFGAKSLQEVVDLLTQYGFEVQE